MGHLKVAIVSTLLDALRQDLKQAVRTLLKSPGFAAIAIASLAIGIAGNAAIFSVADALLRGPFLALPIPIASSTSVAHSAAIRSTRCRIRTSKTCASGTRSSRIWQRIVRRRTPSG